MVERKKNWKSQVWIWKKIREKRKEGQDQGGLWTPRQGICAGFESTLGVSPWRDVKRSMEGSEQQDSWIILAAESWIEMMWPDDEKSGRRRLRYYKREIIGMLWISPIFMHSCLHSFCLKSSHRKQQKVLKWFLLPMFFNETLYLPMCIFKVAESS